MTIALYQGTLQTQWDAKRSIKIDWASYELFVVAVMRDGDLTDGQKLALCREALDAWTRRGHFSGLYIDAIGSPEVQA